MRLSNEYASVTVEVDEEGNGPRLRLTDERAGKTGWLDPLELESLIWAPSNLREALLDPARTRWGSVAPVGDDLVALAERFYTALAEGDRAALTTLLADDFVGELADGLPAPIGGRHEGRDAMIEDGWWAIGRRYAVRAQRDGWYPLGGGGLLVTGRYVGRHREGSATIDAPFTHQWRAADGRLVWLRQVTDTAGWHLDG